MPHIPLFTLLVTVAVPVSGGGLSRINQSSCSQVALSSQACSSFLVPQMAISDVGCNTAQEEGSAPLQEVTS